MLRLSSILISLGLLLLKPSTARAFEYDEHCRMSNHALQIATESVAARHPRRAGSLRASLRNLLSTESTCRKDAKAPRSYGDLVSRVDWARAPGDFYLADLRPDQGGHFSTGEIPWARIDALVATRLQDFRAMHENNEHFGGHALFYFDAWHNRATELAAQGNLAAALVHNAFADHYLEDHFAPGHIYTPRSGLADVITPNMHDRYNRRGAYYRAANTGPLADLLAAIDAPDQIPPAIFNLMQKVCRTTGVWHQARTVLNSCLHQFEIADTLRLHGDGLLHTSPPQELYVTLVMARSVADLLESWVTGNATEHFGEKKWCGYVEREPEVGEEDMDALLWRSPVAAIRYGTYRPENGSGLPQFDHPVILAGVLESFAYSPSAFRVSVATERFVSGWLGSAWLGDPSIGSNAGALKTNQSTYDGYEIFMGCQYGPTECRQGGVGYYRRFLFPVPRVNIQLTGLGGLRVATPPEGGRGPALVLRGGFGPEAGFSLVHMGGRVLAEITAVRGRGPSFSLGLAPSIHGAVPKRQIGLKPANAGSIRKPVSITTAERCFTDSTGSPSLRVSSEHAHPSTRQDR